MTTVRTLTLTRDEAMVLTDRVANTDWGSDEKPVRAYELLLKLGSLYLEVVTTDGVQREAPITLTEAELWLLRAKVTSGDKMGSDPLFGVKLLRKLYTALASIHNEVPLTVGSGDNDREMTPELRVALRERQEKEGGGDDNLHPVAG